jgi:hypothetical protein
MSGTDALYGAAFNLIFERGDLFSRAPRARARDDHMRRACRQQENLVGDVARST